MNHTRLPSDLQEIGRIFRGSVLMLALGGVVACGGGDGGTDPNGGNGDPNAVGPSGGTVTVQEVGVTVTVPAGALSTEVTLTASATSDVPADDDFVDGSGVDIGPDGQQFATPVTLEIGYDESNLPQGVPEGDLRLGTVEGGQWQVVSGSSVDAASNTVSGDVDHFSVFGAVALEVDAVTASISPASISVGETATVQVTATAQDGTELGRDPSFSSDDESVATVSSSGVVTGEGSGTANITVDVGGVTTDVTVEVLPAVATVEVMPTEATIAVDETVQIDATARDSEGQELDRTLSYVSSDESVATVSASGLVTGVARGTATVTVAAGGVSEDVEITVSDPVASIEVDPAEVTLQVDATQQLTVSVVGESGNTLDVDVGFASDAEGVATVGGDGLVTAVAPGVATITISAEGVETTVTITVPLNLADLVGTWSGQWNNQTFATSGDASFELSIDSEAGTFTAVVDMDGNVFGGDNPDPVTFTGMLTEGGISITGTADTYGDYSVTMDVAGNVTGELTNVPGGTVASASFTGTVTGTLIHFDYTIEFEGGGDPAVGVIDLTKDDEPSGGGNTNVSVGDNFFDPQNVTIQQGGSVTWQHEGAALHNISPSGNSQWTTQEFPAGSSDFTVTFETTGTFDYVCQYHPGMEGSITVE